MGKAYSLDHSYGDIAIQFEQLSYMPGQQINGWIFINLVKPFQTNELLLLLTGKEVAKFVEVHYYNNGHSTQRYVHVYKQKQEFYGYNYVIPAPYPNQFPAGQYSYPFSFVLPPNLRSSFLHMWNEEGHRCYGRISYRAKAVFTDYVKKKVLFEKSTVVVNQPPNLMPQAARTATFNGPVKAYCGVDKGVLVMASYCDKESYVEGSSARIGVEIDCSRMKADIKKISIKMVEHIELTAQGRFKAINKTSSRINLPGVPKGQMRLREQGFLCDILISPLGPLQPSVEGNLVKCYYSIEPICDIDRCKCCEPDVKCIFYINLVNQPAQPFQLPSYMQNQWTPQVMPMTICPPSADHVIDEKFRLREAEIKGRS